MSVFTGRLAYPNLKKVVLLELTAGEHLRHWTLDAGSVYYATTVAGPSRAVTDMRENGASLTEGASTSLSAGQWYWDQAAGRVYVCCTGSVSPYTLTLQAIIQFCFSDTGRIYNGIYYDPRLTALPSLSMKIEREFGRPGVLGTGNVELANGDGFFDALSDLQWDAGTATVKMGADDPLFYRTPDLSLEDGFLSNDGEDGFLSDEPLDGFQAPSSTLGSRLARAECAYADFDTIGVFRVSGWSKKDRAFVLQLEDKRKDLKKKIPADFYGRTTYPNMEEDSIGDPIQIAYGVIYDVRPVCIDLPLLKFKVAGHAVKDFTGCRVFDGTTEAWTDVAFASTDEANGEFTLSVDDWDRQASVAVDFSGRVDTAGDLMDNDADVVEDIQTTYLGVAESEIHAASFTESARRLYLGTDPDGNPVNARRVSLYLNKAEDATKIFERINGLAGSYLFPDASGVYRYKVFEPEPGDSVETFDESKGDLFSFVEDVTAEEIVSSVRAAYQRRAQQDYPQVVLYERAEAQYLQGATAAVLLDEDVPCDRMSDALTWAQREARQKGERRRVYKAAVSHRGWPILPAQQIRIVYERHGINQVFEVLEVKRNLSNTLRVELVVGNLHGFGVQAGFLSDDAPVFPDSLGGATAAAWDDTWSDDLKAWARQNVGYISDDNGFADATDPESFNTFIVV